MSDADAWKLREKITAEAERLGLTLLGFAPVERWRETGNQKKEAFPQSLWPWSKTVIAGGAPVFLPMGETTPSNLYPELYNTTNRILEWGIEQGEPGNFPVFPFDG